MKLIKHYDFAHLTKLPEDWTVAVGEKWSNNELQQYVNSEENLFFRDGLVIKATLEDGIIKSGRLHTKNKFKFKYGLVEVIAKIPSGKGTWPAIWMMPNDSVYGGWPKSGEIDIMEHTANSLDELFFCIHTEKYNHKFKEQYYSKKLFKGITKEFHKFSLLWEEDKFVYYLDDVEVASYLKGQDGKDQTHAGWPFNEEFYLILNLAMGGIFGGEVDMQSFPQEFIIKDVKVYQ